MYSQPDTLAVILCMAAIAAAWIVGLLALRVFAPSLAFKLMGGK
tara:strand:+ start:2601 stop:2732 length:132 start_codon:yes stop_codon:yes gene_type:complete